MSQQFKEQGGAATMDPSPLARRLTSNLASYLNSERKLIKRRLKAEKARKGRKEEEEREKTTEQEEEREEE